jgi:PRTRC genetic system ThiF family protein
MKTKKKETESGRGIVHYTEQYLIDPSHPVTVNLIGCGGTGSQVLNSLARMNAALIRLGHPGLYVRAIDPKTVTDANMGRQLFSPADVDEYKSVVLIGRINRFFQSDWEAIPELYDSKAGIAQANITISCVDSGKARVAVIDGIGHKGKKAYYYQEPWEQTYYWMDFGNMQDRGQVVLGTLKEIQRFGKSEFICRQVLPTIDKLHPEILVDNKDDDQGPSCSLAEALNKQDLFINTNLANMGMAILWKMFRELHIKSHGLYLNLSTMVSTPIKIK